jgi:hypothetical protein
VNLLLSLFATCILLEVSIPSIFAYRDKLAIHTLAGAAHEILKDLGKKKGVTSLIKNVVGIKEDKRTEYFRLVMATVIY